MPPGWKVRHSSKNMRNQPGFAVGGGTCKIAGPLDFGGRGDRINYATSIIKWFPGEINWYTFDGLWTLNDLPTLPASALVASYEYPRSAASWVPDPGTAAPHINLWHVSGKYPRRAAASLPPPPSREHSHTAPRPRPLPSRRALQAARPRRASPSTTSSSTFSSRRSAWRCRCR